MYKKYMYFICVYSATDCIFNCNIVRFINNKNNLNLPCSNSAWILRNDISEYLPHSRKYRCISWLSCLVFFMINFVLSKTFTTVLCTFYVIFYQNHSVKWGNYSCKIKCYFIRQAFSRAKNIALDWNKTLSME